VIDAELTTDTSAPSETSKTSAGSLRAIARSDPSRENDASAMLPPGGMASAAGMPDSVISSSDTTASAVPLMASASGLAAPMLENPKPSSGETTCTRPAPGSAT
jgi:hypothetical protein